MAGLVQIIEFKTSLTREIEALSRPSRTRGRTPPTLRCIVPTADMYYPGTYSTIVGFDSVDLAMVNSGRPVTSDFAAKIAAQCHGPVTFQNLDVLWKETTETVRTTVRSRTWLP